MMRCQISLALIDSREDYGEKPVRRQNLPAAMEKELKRTGSKFGLIPALLDNYIYPVTDVTVSTDTSDKHA